MYIEDHDTLKSDADKKNFCSPFKANGRAPVRAMKCLPNNLVRKYKNKSPTLASQSWQKNRQKGLANKKSVDIFLQKSDVTEHD